MENYICTTCGTQFDGRKKEPRSCPICEDERQYVNPNGQRWTTLKNIKRDHRIVFQKKEKNLFGVGMTPKFGIGQRALLIQTTQGNVLWDCISLIDEATVDIINGLGGLAAIAISHPHYYTSMVEWSKAFGNVPIYLHKADKKWIQYPHKTISFWEGVRNPIMNGITLYKIGGHFDGGTILHWEQGTIGKGALLTGDILQVVSDRRHVSFMYSYPNHIALNTSIIDRITSILNPLNYERIYGAWWDQNILNFGKKALLKSAERYINAITEH